MSWKDVPDRSPFGFGDYRPFKDWWDAGLHPGAWNSAVRAGVFFFAKRGPRGGAWAALLSHDRWAEWVKAYKARAEKFEQGKQRNEVLARLGAGKKLGHIPGVWPWSRES